MASFFSSTGQGDGFAGSGSAAGGCRSVVLMAVRFWFAPAVAAISRAGPDRLGSPVGLSFAGMQPAEQPVRGDQHANTDDPDDEDQPHVLLGLDHEDSGQRQQQADQ